MAKANDLHSDMAHARQSDGINVIFDQRSPPHSHSRSCSSSSSRRSSSPAPSRGRQRGRYRSSSSSSSSSSRSRSSHSRSRSHPRCHRGSSRCRCDNHSRYVRGRYRRSPPRGRRTRRHSRACSPSPDRYSHRRSYRSRSRSYSRPSGYQSRHKNRRLASRHSRRVSQSPRNRRTHSKSPSPGHSVHLSREDKRKLLEAAQANAMRILGTNNLDLPDSVKPILPAKPESKWEMPETRVRHDSEKTQSQSEAEPEDDLPSPKTSPKSKIIAFSVHNSVAKPTVAASGARVTARVDSYESRNPYGHWIPVKSV